MTVMTNKQFTNEEIKKLSKKNYMNNKYILESLASDLKRVAMGLHRGSKTMAQRFLEEARKRRKEVEIKIVSPYIQRILSRLDDNIDAEKALMYSTLIQNYTQYKKV